MNNDDSIVHSDSIECLTLALFQGYKQFKLSIIQE